MPNDLMWKAKLAARIHDPAEKALILLRDPAGHENGTSRALARLLGLFEIRSGTVETDADESLSKVVFKEGLPLSLYRLVQRADWWAAAADRPQWPMQEIVVSTKSGEQRALKVADWAQVRWTSDPVLIHPLTGATFRLAGGLRETDIGDIKRRSFEHHSRLLAAFGAGDGSAQAMRKILLALWRFGPELTEEEDFGKLGELWRLLPADTRVPDHSIWDHLDLASAFAGAFADDPDGDAALLALSIGPVQSFIAAARKTEDLWAGSHLLSRIAWEAIKPLCEVLGPDAIVFPRLRGIAQVDVWLRDEMNLPHTLFERCEWMQGSSTDANPLFSAALPNRFVAVVPASRAKALAEEATSRVRAWLCARGAEVVDRLLEEARLRSKGAPRDESIYAYRQMRDQLDGFPEVHWAAVPFSLIRPRNQGTQTGLDVAALSSAMAAFFGVAEGEPCGFFATDAWSVLAEDTALKDEAGRNSVFFAPNPGALYPAVYDLAERLLAAAKSVRPFGQHEQHGWRCSLTGETEWITVDPDQLKRSYRQQSETLWARVAKERPAWAKSGEHLGALPAIKRLWPTLFAEEVAVILGLDRSAADRFVVSTHTMALAANLESLDRALSVPGAAERFDGLVTKDDRAPALPRSLARLRGSLAARIPAALDRLCESDSPDAEEQRRRLENEVKSALGHKPESYYALLLMDGDRMGRILSGDPQTAISYRESFHPQVREGFDQHASRSARVHRYGEQKRALSPNRHLAISGALNDFSQTVVRHVVEIEHRGRVIYSGGDDVLAMLPVANLLSTMVRLRQAYSGHDPAHEGGVHGDLTLHDGFAALRSGGGAGEPAKLMRMMGASATASCGAVIAHHMAPLSAVMRELRAAESRAKSEGGRDAFSITVMKRSGGALRFTAKWEGHLTLLGDLRAFLTGEAVSRRAVYNSLEWLRDLPEPEGDGAMLETLLAYQFRRQTRKEGAADAADPVGTLARRLTELAMAQPKCRLDWLGKFLTVAEFLAREARGGEAA